MKKPILSLLLLVSVFMFSACGKNLEFGDVFIYDVNTIEGLSMEVVGPATESAATVRAVNYTDKDYVSDILFSVQAERDGVWYRIEPDLPENFETVADTVAYSRGSETEIYCPWSLSYGSLPDGHYRIVYALYEVDTWFSGDAYYVTTEFYIE